MRAVVYTTYGGPEVLRLAEVPVPTVAEDGVVVRVRAASLHKGDWHLMTGTPYLVRAMGFGLLRPKYTTAGMAIAGTIEAVGGRVAGFAVGDDVLCELGAGGGFADLVAVPAVLLAKKPASLSWEDAAALPVSATTALQGLRDAGQLKPGQSVLVVGASGGVGTFAVQIARAMGAEVTGVCSGRNAELVRSLGASAVIDYTAGDFTTSKQRFDIIFDTICDQPLAACRRVLTPNGRYVSCGGGERNRWTGPMIPMLWGMLGNLFTRQPFVPLMATPNPADLAAVAELVASGAVRPVIDRRFPLGEAADAMRYLGSGRVRGKCLLTL